MLTQHFSLTEEEKKDLSKSGQMEKFLNRKGFIKRSSKGHYQITPQGIEYLNQHSEEIPLLDRNPEAGIDLSASGAEGDGDTPSHEEFIEENYQSIQKKLASDLLEKIKDNTPAFFEKLVIDLLVKMGYGGSREDAGRAVRRSGDGGIDGIINEDRLGLDVVYIQAKQWKDTVSRPEIQKFAGALQDQRARKGVFITTSGFTKGAEEYVKTIDSKIILIDGNQLAQYMIEHNVGVSIEKTYEIKRVDSDYFSGNTANS